MRRSREAPKADAGTVDAEEYLDRCGVTAYMKDCVTLLLENRPDEPLTFMSNYFRTVTQPSSPLLRAYLLSDAFMPEVNRLNPMGTQGKMVEDFAALLKVQLHRSCRASI